ncbi:MAG TPA: hypothetical protein VGQ26_20630 [Streptosporangiaceae bacterium]|nr:hypothetical protein [Streptosporangiaceae bacterium]
MRYRLMATYRGVPYEVGLGPSNFEVVLFAACPPPEELGFEPATGHWRKQVIRAEIDALWESRPVGTFRGEPCIVLDDPGDRLHIAYLGTDPDRAASLGYWQVDRGVFELLAPGEEVTGLNEERVDKPLRWGEQADETGPMASYPYGTAPWPVAAPPADIPLASAPHTDIPPFDMPRVGAQPARTQSASAPPTEIPRPSAPPTEIPRASAPLDDTPPANAPLTDTAPDLPPPVDAPAADAPLAGARLASAPLASATLADVAPTRARQAKGTLSAAPAQQTAPSQPAAPAQRTTPVPGEAGAQPPADTWPAHMNAKADPYQDHMSGGDVNSLRDETDSQPLPVPPGFYDPENAALADITPSSDVGGRAARRQRVPTREIFCELADLASIPRAAYALETEIEGAMCLLPTPDGFDVFIAADGVRHELRSFADEEAAYFYLFGVLMAEAIRSGAQAPAVAATNPYSDRV